MKNKLTNQSCYRMLSNVDNVLRNNQIEYWLDQGTLLGLIRDQDLIDWDWDLDLSAKFENERTILDLVSKFKLIGFHAKYIKRSQSIRLEPKDKYYGWRHIDIHFCQKTDASFITYFYEFTETTILQSLLLKLVLIFDKIERVIGKANPSRRQVYFSESDKVLDTTHSVNWFQKSIAKVAYRIKNLFYDLRLRYFGQFVKVTTPAKFLEEFESLDVFGKQYLVPSNPKTYLQFRYGVDWEIPLKNYDWHDDGAVKN